MNENSVPLPRTKFETKGTNKDHAGLYSKTFADFRFS